jgi:hypothetical protein
MTIGNIPPTLRTLSLLPPPKKYYYTVTYVHNFAGLLWPEELPLVNRKDFLFAAHIPDKYMVLVQRESVNYEMCGLMSKVPDPKKSNHCEYLGIAATPLRQMAQRLIYQMASMISAIIYLLIDMHWLANGREPQRLAKILMGALNFRRQNLMPVTTTPAF